MMTWVIYDITHDRTRTKVARRCLDFGLYRVQRSVFLGDIDPLRIEEIEIFSRDLMDLETDSVYIFQMCREDYEKVRMLGRGFDRKVVGDEVLTQVI